MQKRNPFLNSSVDLRERLARLHEHVNIAVDNYSAHITTRSKTRSLHNLLETCCDVGQYLLLHAEAEEGYDPTEQIEPDKWDDAKNPSRTLKDQYLATCQGGGPLRRRVSQPLDSITIENSNYLKIP